ncbi:hypothetical protein GCM10011581_09570 [Saccharopolyspora subtropica]|uniref:Uncharacterized protein n=2 Tax=Saccharopolyspora thermophila TaxID=89367 RepID=A0A917N7S7_9PSEU|nr:hypothetical protein GCM10011581_09570 [Saccharopolyspora subtropica]
METMHSHTGVSGVDHLALALRVLLLTSTALIAGIGLLRAGATVPRWLAWAAGGMSAAVSGISAVVLDINPGFAVAHAVLALAIPVAVRWRTAAAYLGFALTLLLIAEAALGHTSLVFFLDTVFAAVAVVWFGAASATSWRDGSGLRPGPVALTAALALAGAAIGQLLLSGLFDRRLWGSAHGFVLVGAVVASLAVLVLVVVLHNPQRAFRTGAIGVLAVVVAWSVLPGIPHPPELPVPGVARLTQAAGTPVLVSPHRPGRNLVHFPDSAGLDVVVESGGRLARAVPRPGASGTWAEVDLPPGRSELLVRRGAEQGSVDVDTGTLPPLPDAAGADGPECASAALGGIVAAAASPLDRCPAASLSTEDEDALRKLVDYLASRHTPAVTVVGDDAPRSRAAADVVLSQAQQRGLPVRDDPGGALVLVAGWSRAVEVLDATNRGRGYTYGVHLAPWLLHGPVVNAVAGASLPLRFDPRDRQALSYGMDLAATFGEPPSPAGFRRWLAARGAAPGGEVTIYASAQVDVMQMANHQHDSTAGQWIPEGTIVAISDPL